MEKKDCEGYVYLLGDWENDGMFKIGVTKGSLERRIKKLQTGNPGEIYLCKYYKAKYPFFVEKTLHFRLTAKKVLNEWFSLTFDDIVNFEKMCKDIEDMADSMKNNPFFQKNLK